MRLLLILSVYGAGIILYLAAGVFMEKEGLEFRSWVKWTALILGYLIPAGTLLGYLIWGIEKLKAGLREVLLVLLVIAVLVLAAGFFLLLFIGALMFPEEKKLDNGLLEVRYATFRETEVYECRPVGFLARTAGRRKVSSKEAENVPEITVSPTPNPTSVPSEEEGANESAKTEQESNPLETPEGSYQVLYEAVLSETYSMSRPGYNAKGNFYSVLEEGTAEYEGRQVPYDITAVYDRKSDDGTSQWFVLYKNYYKETEEETSVMEAEILGGYAVHMETGEVSEREIYW